MTFWIKNLHGFPSLLFFFQIPKLRDTESETVLYTLIAESDGLSSSQLPEKIRSAVKENSLPFYIKVSFILKKLRKAGNLKLVSNYYLYFKYICTFQVIAHQYSWLKNGTLDIDPKIEMDLQLNQMLETLENILGKAQVSFIFY